MRGTFEQLFGGIWKRAALWGKDIQAEETVCTKTFSARRVCIVQGAGVTRA